MKKKNTSRADFIKASFFEFEPQPVTDPKVGEVYIHPAYGPVKCEDRKSTPIAGAGDIEMVSFKELMPSANAVPREFTLALMQLNTHNMRLLAGEDAMDAAMRKLGEPEESRRPFRHAEDRRLLYTNMMKSGDLNVLVDLLGQTLGSDRVLSSATQKRSVADAEIGYDALNVFTREYAVVKKIGLDESRKLAEQQLLQSRRIVAQRNGGKLSLLPA